MKKIIAAALTLALSVSSAAGLTAMAADDVTIQINGEELQIPQGDTKPFIENDRTLVPMRVIFEAFGATVEWDDATKTITAYEDRQDIEIKMQIGSDVFTVNDSDVKLDVPAQIVDGRTVVPLRAVSEGLNAEVKWDGETRTVYINNRSDIPAPTVIGEIHSSIQHEQPSPEWVTNLEQAKDENTKQLFVVAGMGMDKTTASISMHERDENGNWIQILSTPGYVGKNGQTPIGVYHFNKAFGIADNPGCEFDYVKVTDNTYWSGDMRDGMRYNEMVDIKDYPDLDMENSEHITDYEYQYQYCLNISFNEDGTQGRGSAIFLHCLGPTKPYTGGCVALPENIMKMVMQRVNEDCVVVIDTLDNMGGSL